MSNASLRNYCTSRSRSLGWLMSVLALGLQSCAGGAAAPSSSAESGSSSAGAVAAAGGDASSTAGGAGTGVAGMGAGSTAGSAGAAGSTGAAGDATAGLYPESVLCPAPTTKSDVALSGGFAASCAGCHGAMGQGQTSQTGAAYPSLQSAAKTMSLADFTGVVRSGRKLMPSFGSAAVPDSQLMQDCNALRGTTVTASADPDCGPGALELPSAPQADLEARIAKGIAVYRKPGLKGACSGCHSAAGIDMAFIGFSDAAILRRAVDANQMSTDDAQAIVDFVHALRIKYNVTRPLHPIKFRFLQPKSEPLEPVKQEPFDGIALGGQGPSQDRAFALQLADKTKLLLVTDTIDSLDKAKAAQDQVMTLDYKQLPTGIPLERWTEDGFNGPEHNIPNEWIPMLTRNPAPGHESEWFSKVDAYRADPSDANLWAMYDSVDSLTVGDHAKDYLNAAEWSRNKYLSVQIASHMLLHHTLSLPDALAVPNAPTDAKARRDIAIAHNPFWIAGDKVRLAPLDEKGVDGLMSFPANLDLTINKGEPAQGTSDGARLLMTRNDMMSWFWIGFTNDPGLLVQENAIATLDTDYFNSNLVFGGYNVHSAFVVNVAMFHKANAPAEYMTMRAVATEGTGVWASPRPFMVFKQNERDLHFLSPGDLRTPIHAKLWANTFRAAIYLMNDEVARTNKVFDRTRTLLNVNFMHHWFSNGSLEPGVDHTDLDALVEQLRNRLKAADEIGQVTVYPDSGGVDALDPVVLCDTGLDLSVPMCTSWGKI